MADAEHKNRSERPDNKPGGCEYQPNEAYHAHFDEDHPDWEHEHATSEACEAFVFEVLTDAPDEWITWVLSRVKKDERVRLIEQIRSAVDVTEYKPAHDDLVVLRKLSTYHRAVQHKDLVEALEKDGTPLSTRTIGPLMKRLHLAEMIHYPHGPRKGATVTDKGHSLLQKNPPV